MLCFDDALMCFEGVMIEFRVRTIVSVVVIPSSLWGDHVGKHEGRSGCFPFC